MKRKIVTFIVGVMAITSLVGCGTEADTVNHNLSKSADSFEGY